jgi:hypothetical protein
MPANTAVTAALIVTGEVPPDQNCITTVDALLPVIAANMAVQTTDPDNPQSQTDSTAELALNTANTALAQVTALQATIPARRTSGSNLIPISSSGDTNVSIGWAPDMPNVAYQVNITLHGPVGATNGPDWIVVDGTRLVNGVQLRFLNTPAGTWSFSYEVIAL